MTITTSDRLHFLMTMEKITARIRWHKWWRNWHEKRSSYHAAKAAIHKSELRHQSRIGLSRITYYREEMVP